MRQLQRLLLPSTARNTIPRVVFARDPRRPTCRCRPINSFSDSKINRLSLGFELRELKPAAYVLFPRDRIMSDHRLPADQSRLAVD